VAADSNGNPISDFEGSLAIGSLALAPSDPSVVYAGTGNWSYGMGVLKSIDAGRDLDPAPQPIRCPFGEDPLARIIHERLRPPLRSFPPMLRQHSSAMHFGIADVALPCLDEESLSRTTCTPAV